MKTATSYGGFGGIGGKENPDRNSNTTKSRKRPRIGTRYQQASHKDLHSCYRLNIKFGF